ncbi:hypothetical protein E2C01_080379 [Portunus trituberculatus]|uniref:Uncharacterized protein n=1 Tax=Portunus trituberculatus TaxID=210409 RepID=A0A5B7IVX9_PORTR|nr:hypothetical protein [Portunus trituberculatus]
MVIHNATTAGHRNPLSTGTHLQQPSTTTTTTRPPPPPPPPPVRRCIKAQESVYRNCAPRVYG